MAALDPQVMNLARQARDKLYNKIGAKPGVRLIDISRDKQPSGSGLPGTGRPGDLVLRVYLQASAVGKFEIPDQIDGFPIRVLIGDMRPDDQVTQD